MTIPPTFRRRAPLWFLALSLVLAGLVASCTGSEEPSGTTSTGPTTSASPVTALDAYVYTDPAGIEARLKIGADGATLTVINDTGAPLPVPGIYVLDARDGTRVRWKVMGAAPVADGRTDAFQVTRPAIPEPKHIGLVAMLFGGEDYGAFTPPRAEVAA